MAKELIRFDWAMKKMLRHKANFDILEGFLSELLGEEVKIKQILDAESNKETENDKYNRVDILVEFSTGELVIIEIQDSKEHDYLHLFSDDVNDKLDEWIYFFKNAEIKTSFSAKGLKEASKRLSTMRLNEEEQKEYNRYLMHLHEVASGNYNDLIETQDLINKSFEEGQEKKEVEMTIEMYNQGIEIGLIAIISKKPVEIVKQTIDEYLKSLNK